MSHDERNSLFTSGNDWSTGCEFSRGNSIPADGANRGECGSHDIAKSFERLSPAALPGTDSTLARQYRQVRPGHTVLAREERI